MYMKVKERSQAVPLRTILLAIQSNNGGRPITIILDEAQIPLTVSAASSSERIAQVQRDLALLVSITKQEKLVSFLL